MEIIEVFKTNVETGEQAKRLVHLIHENFPEHIVNFDLDDCDRILRIRSVNGSVQPQLLINLLNDSGFEAVVLSDEIPAYISNSMFSVK